MLSVLRVSVEGATGGEGGRASKLAERHASGVPSPKQHLALLDLVERKRARARERQAGEGLRVGRGGTHSHGTAREGRVELHRDLPG